MLSLLPLLPALAFLSDTASAHGNLRKWVIAGKDYITYLPYSYPDFKAAPQGIARFLGNGINPMKDPLSAAMACNVASYPAPMMANVTAGSTVTAVWNEWPHVGPMYTYMSPCPNGRDCSDFLGTESRTWFKIEEAGVVAYPYPWATSPGLDWASQLMYDADNTWNITIPKCLPSGPYLIRHETMAVHDAATKGGAQFYPNCAQFWVSGGTGKLLDLNAVGVKLPGDIQPNDPGVLFNPSKPLTDYTYIVPGSRPIVCPS